MKHRILLLLLLLSCQFSIGQGNFTKDTLFFDENNIKIDNALGIKKCLSKVFHCKVMEYDSLVTYTTYYKYFFGRLNKLEHNQYISLLNNRIDVKTDENSTVVISFWKTITNYDNYTRITDSLHNSPSHNRSPSVKHKQFDESEHKNYISGYIKKQKRCIKKTSKIGKITPVYLYQENFGRNINNKVFTWKKDYNGLFMKKFFGEKMQKFHMLILKPNGNYFLKSGKANMYDFGETEVFDLLKDTNWDAHHKKWNRRLTYLPKSTQKVSVSSSFEPSKFNFIYNCF